MWQEAATILRRDSMRTPASTSTPAPPSANCGRRPTSSMRPRRARPPGDANPLPADRRRVRAAARDVGQHAVGASLQADLFGVCALLPDTA
jgi:hypothetical protein